MRKAMLAAVALAGLVLAATAQAKGPIQLCGPASCAPLGSETAPPIPLGAGPEMQLVPPVAPTGYYEIRFADVEGVLGYWVPAAGAVRLRDAVGLAAWVAADANQLALLQQASAGIAAYTAPTKADVWVNGAFVRSPVGYLRLFSVGTPVATWAGNGGWWKIFISARRSTPWTDGANSVWISRKGSFLKRDGQVLWIAPSLAKRIRARLPLAR